MANETRTEREPPENPEPVYRLPPGFFLRSFAIIMIGYFGFYIALCLLAIGIGMVIEGESFVQAFEVDEGEEFDPQAAPAFDELYSPLSAWLLLGLNTITGMGMGYLVARLAQFGRFGHGTFLAVAFFITFLQVLFAEDPFAPPWLTIAHLGFIPAATLFGAKFCEIRWLIREAKMGNTKD